MCWIVYGYVYVESLLDFWSCGLWHLFTKYRNSALESLTSGAILFLTSSNKSRNQAKVAPWEVNIGATGYPPKVPNNRSDKNAPQRESIKQLAPKYRNAALYFDIWSKIALRLIQKVKEIGPRVPQGKLTTVQRWEPVKQKLVMCIHIYIYIHSPAVGLNKKNTPITYPTKGRTTGRIDTGLDNGGTDGQRSDDNNGTDDATYGRTEDDDVDGRTRRDGHNERDYYIYIYIYIYIYTFIHLP